MLIKQRESHRFSILTLVYPHINMSEVRTGYYNINSIFAEKVLYLHNKFEKRAWKYGGYTIEIRSKKQFISMYFLKIL